MNDSIYWTFWIKTTVSTRFYYTYKLWKGAYLDAIETGTYKDSWSTLYHN